MTTFSNVTITINGQKFEPRNISIERDAVSETTSTLLASGWGRYVLAPTRTRLSRKHKKRMRKMRAWAFARMST